MNVAALLRKTAAAFPSRAALASGSGTLTYSELLERAGGFGQHLRTSGLNPGDRVALYMHNSGDYLIALLGVLDAGLAVVPVNVKLHPDELTYILQHSGARAIVFGEAQETQVANALTHCTDVLTVRALSMSTLKSKPGSVAPVAEVAPDDLAWLFYTSGTTGRPKGAMLTHRNLLAMTMNCLADLYSFDEHDVVLHVAPLSHGSGLFSLPPIARGSLSIVTELDRFEPTEILELAHATHATIIPFVVPTMIVRMTSASPALSAPSLRAVIYGGAPILVDDARRAIERFGSVFIQMYGLGEAPMTITYLRAEDHRTDDEHILASAGRPRTDVEVAIVDDAGDRMAIGQIGEVVVRGDVVMAGYWHDPEATAKALRGGWLHTRDVGRFDEDGRLTLLDRMNDVVISGGANIYPREVEDVLVRHPGIHEVAVFGVPDPEWGESVVAAVVPAPDHAITAGELIDYCRDHLASYKKPRRIEFVESLPRSAYGKLLRRSLRETYSEQDGT